MTMSLVAPSDPLAAYRVAREPFYQPSADELTLFEAAHARRLPLILKGPTGCGKTRFIEHMAWRLKRPLVTVACHEDLSAGDLIGRWLLDADSTRWQDGPLTLAVRFGGICHLDELVEARANTTVVIHPLTDTRRMLPLAPRNEIVHAHPDFQLVVSYNPTPMAREMKASTRQRFCAMEVAYPSPSARPTSSRASRRLPRSACARAACRARGLTKAHRRACWSTPCIAAGVIHLPAQSHWRRHSAAAAHAAAHLVYSPPSFDGSGLGAIVRSLVALLEDARVEALAMRELPGLARLWRPLHTATPALGAGFEALLQRLARALADPGYDDPHAGARHRPDAPAVQREDLPPRARLP